MSIQISRTAWLLFAVCLLSELTTGRRHRRNDKVQSGDNQCYSRGRSQKCLPGFKDVARHMPIHASSTCGHPANTICHPSSTGGRTECTVCDASDPKKWHPPAFLTDKHPTNETCWISGPVDPFGDTTVNVTISFGKRFEILYMYILPCFQLPDSIVFHKSTDFGQTWQAWRYFSKDCFRAFGMATTETEGGYSHSRPNSYTPVCKQLKPLSRYTGRDSEERIVFSSSAIRTDDDDPALIDWRTATDLRVTLSSFRSSPPLRSRRVINDFVYNRYTSNDEPPKIHYSFSQLSVGGRCKCNGHANQCVWKDNRLRCECSHNTEGDDCERCKPFFYDQPWSRATDEDAHVCKACNCNRHSQTCRFNKNAYVMSQRASGGVCIDCQDNTMGPHCEQCAPGYYRDPNKPITDAHACTVCNCHPLGSKDVGNCDPLSGQCKCKPGVTGQTCNRCKPGYQQSNDLLHPCQPVHNTLGDASATPKCGECRSRKRRIRFKKFCRRDFAMHMLVRSRRSFDTHVRFQVNVYSVFRRRGEAQQFVPPRRSSTPIVLWVAKSNLLCKCPDVRLGKAYLLLSDANIHRHQGQANLVLNHKSTLIPWMTSMRRRMIKFKRKEKRGRCPVGRRQHRKRNIGRKRRKNRKSASSRSRDSRKRKSRKNRRKADRYPSYEYYRGSYQGDRPSLSDTSLSNRQSSSNQNNYGYYGLK